MLSSVTPQFSRSKQLGYSRIPDFKKPEINFFLNIPDEALFIIFKNVNLPDLIHLNLSCKKFKKLTDVDTLYEIFTSELNIHFSQPKEKQPKEKQLKKIAYSYYLNLRKVAKKETEHALTKFYLKKTNPKKQPTIENILSLKASLHSVDIWKVWVKISIFTYPPRLQDFDAKKDEFANWILTNPPEIDQANIKCRKINLSSFPVELKLFPRLTHLFLSHNHLKEIPEEIGLLTALEVLNISKNHLMKITFAIGNLTNLRFLKISHNHLTILPSLSKLKKLDYLNCSHNYIDEFPKNLHRLKCLETLSIFNNCFGTIPDTIVFSKNLKNLNIDPSQMCTKFLEIPPERLKINVVTKKSGTFLK